MKLGLKHFQMICFALIMSLAVLPVLSGFASHSNTQINVSNFNEQVDAEYGVENFDHNVTLSQAHQIADENIFDKSNEDCPNNCCSSFCISFFIGSDNSLTSQLTIDSHAMAPKAIWIEKSVSELHRPPNI